PPGGGDADHLPPGGPLRAERRDDRGARRPPSEGARVPRARRGRRDRPAEVGAPGSVPPDELLRPLPAPDDDRGAALRAGRELTNRFALPLSAVRAVRSIL